MGSPSLEDMWSLDKSLSPLMLVSKCRLDFGMAGARANAVHSKAEQWRQGWGISKVAQAVAAPAVLPLEKV